MKTLKFERLISKLCLNDNITISGFIDVVEDDDRFIEFLYRIPYDNHVYSCQLDINLNFHKVKDILNYITEKFYPEFHEMLEDEYIDVDKFMASLHSSPDDDDEDEEYESADSVAAGLGMMIDDDNNWVPDDRDYVSYEYPILDDYEDENDKSIINYSKEYIYFMITYQEKE